jgi:hypothetical protein
LGALGACVTVGIWLASRWLSTARNQAYDNPMALFRALCQAHGLLTKERTFLRQLAMQCRLARPAEIFLRPDCFAVEGLPGDFKSRADEIHRLKKRLFANE